MISKKSSKPQPFQYRLSEKTINLWTKILIATMTTGIIGGFAFSAIALSIVDKESDKQLNLAIAGWIVIGVGIAIPLLVSAILGGIAIHKYGYIGTTLLIVSMITFGFAATTGSLLFTIVSVIGIIAGGLLTFLFGYLGKVPMWLQLPTISSPRLYIGKGGEGAKKNKVPIAYVATIFVISIIIAVVAMLSNK